MGNEKTILQYDLIQKEPTLNGNIEIFKQTQNRLRTKTSCKSCIKGY